MSDPVAEAREWLAQPRKPAWATKVISALVAEVEKQRGAVQFMVERAADQKLDGYRELGQRAAQAEAERDEAREALRNLSADFAAYKQAVRENAQR